MRTSLGRVRCGRFGGPALRRIRVELEAAGAGSIQADPAGAVRGCDRGRSSAVIATTFPRPHRSVSCHFLDGGREAHKARRLTAALDAQPRAP